MEPQIEGEINSLTEFEQSFTTAFTDSVDFLGADEEGFFVVLQPGSFDMADTRTVQDLTPYELSIIQKVAFEQFEIDEMGEPFKTYETEGPLDKEGHQTVIQVRIFETNRQDIGVFLHEVRYGDGSVIYGLAPQDHHIE